MVEIRYKIKELFQENNRAEVYKQSVFKKMVELKYKTNELDNKI